MSTELVCIREGAPISEALKEESKVLNQCLGEMVLAFRTPQSNIAYSEKINVLETEILRLQERLSQGHLQG